MVGLRLCPGVLGHVLKPGHLAQIVHAVPARKMIQFTKLPSADPVTLVGQVDGYSLAKPFTRLRETYFVKISHDIRFFIDPGVA